MAITFALAKATPYTLSYLLTHDGQAGDAAVIDNAQMVADLLAAGVKSPLAALVGFDQVANTQALARRAMLGQGTAVDPVDVNEPHAQCEIKGRAGLVTWLVDADVDAVTATRNELNVTSSAGVAGTAILTLHFEHTYDR